MRKITQFQHREITMIDQGLISIDQHDWLNLRHGHTDGNTNFRL